MLLFLSIFSIYTDKVSSTSFIASSIWCESVAYSSLVLLVSSYCVSFGGAFSFYYNLVSRAYFHTTSLIGFDLVACSFLVLSVYSHYSAFSFYYDLIISTSFHAASSIWCDLVTVFLILLISTCFVSFSSAFSLWWDSIYSTFFFGTSSIGCDLITR